MKRTLKPILITGSHRSGSTWAGQMLAVAPHVAYIHEPFNIAIKAGVNPEPFKYWFQYICEENSKYYDSVIDGIIHYKYPINSVVKQKTTRGIIKVIRDKLIFSLHRINNDRPLIKDPIALFSAEWLYKKFNMDILVMIRHPAAFCSSLKIKDWKFDFNHFLKQPLLMEKYLGKFEKKICEYTKTEKHIIDQAILLWNCTHYTINIYRENHPEWLFIKHEDLSRDPIQQFQSIYEAFNLEFTDRAKSRILKSSGSHNPIEQQVKNEFLRNSKENVYSWKNRLSRSEIDLIKVQTSEVSTLFYSESEW